MTRKFIPMALAAALTASLGLVGAPHIAQGAEATPAAAAGSYKGEHEMTGKVSKIDHKTGMLSVSTALGKMDLHFPPPSVADLKQGDEITVKLGYKKVK